jgi:hypothetical protein
MPFTSWEGLEEDKLSDIKSCIRDIKNLKANIAKKKSTKRSCKQQEKQESKIEEELSKLKNVVRD